MKNRQHYSIPTALFLVSLPLSALCGIGCGSSATNASTIVGNGGSLATNAVNSLGLGPAAVSLAATSVVALTDASSYVMLSKAGISSQGSAGSITGNIGVSPASYTYITGTVAPAATITSSSTSAVVIGKIYASDYAVPSPANMTAAISSMQTAYADAAGRTSPTSTELGAGNIGSKTITPGLYKWSSAVTIPTNLTLSGGANDIWIFQIAQTLTVASATQIILAGGALAKNIYWQVAGAVYLGTTATFSGTILCQTAITMDSGSTLNGRAYAQTAINLGTTTTVTQP
jgi:hypothetical protein